jgi:hypothetical protein
MIFFFFSTRASHDIPINNINNEVFHLSSARQLSLLRLLMEFFRPTTHHPEMMVVTTRLLQMPVSSSVSAVSPKEIMPNPRMQPLLLLLQW